MRPRGEILQALASSEAIPRIEADSQDEMAIPSYTHANPLIRSLMWQRLTAVEQMLPDSPSGSCLDFGCGLGFLLPALCCRFESVYALDLHPELAEELAAREGLRVAFLESLEAVPDAELSALVAADVLEHLDDLPAWIDESSRTLRPDGRLVVSGPTENMLYRIGRSIAGFSGKGHYHHRNIADIRLALEENGYMVERRVVLPSRAVPLFEVLRFMREPG